MKISLIAPVYKDKKNFYWFLSKINDQKNKNFELILVIDSNYEDVLSIVDEFKGKFENKLKVIFNTKRNSRIDGIKKAVQVAQGEYCVLLSVSNIFHNSMVDNLIDASKKDSDIIEFRARLRGVVRHDGVLRKQYDEPVEISKNKDIFAYTYPFDFNKMFKTKLLKEITPLKWNLTLNSKFSIELLYTALLTASTYSTYDKKIVRMKVKNYITFNPLKMIKEWEELFRFIEIYKKDFNLEPLRYAMYFTEFAITNQYVYENGAKVLIDKFEKKLKTQLNNEFKGILKTNKYFNNGSKESEVIKKRSLEGEYRKILKELN